MNKRSAMVVAAGLVAALLAGGAALSFSLSGGTAVAQDGGRVKPIVKTERRTVTIHKRAKAGPAEVVTISGPSASAGGTSTSSDGDDAEEPFDDEAFEDEHETEHETEHEGGVEDESSDNSGSGGSGGDD